MHQPLLINIVEGMLSSMEEAEPRLKVSPCAVPGTSFEELVAASDNAEIIEHLLGYQFRIDDFAFTGRPGVIAFRRQRTRT